MESIFESFTSKMFNLFCYLSFRRKNIYGLLSVKIISDYTFILISAEKKVRNFL